MHESRRNHHILWKGNNPRKHILQTLFVKLVIFSDFTFILHVFRAECACFLTYLVEMTYNLSKSRSRLKEKNVDSCIVGLGLS